MQRDFLLRIVCPAFIVSNVPIFSGTGDNPRASREEGKSLPQSYTPSLRAQVVKSNSWAFILGEMLSPSYIFISDLQKPRQVCLYFPSLLLPPFSFLGVFLYLYLSWDFEAPSPSLQRVAGVFLPLDICRGLTLCLHQYLNFFPENFITSTSNTFNSSYPLGVCYIIMLYFISHAHKLFKIHFGQMLLENRGCSLRHIHPWLWRS